MSDDFYDLLDVPEDASQEEIKKAFREQVRIYHPDLNDDDRAQAQFTVLKKAYDILGDPVERQAYDRLGHEEYVAKRTTGIPSPDLWQNGDDEGATASEDSRATASSSTSSSSSATRSRTSTTGSGSGSGSSSTSGSTTRSGTGTGTSSSTTTGASSSTGSPSGSSASDGATAGASAADSSTSSSTDDGATASASHTETESESSGFTDNAIVQWWQRQSFGWPLVWTAALTYLLGLVHFGLENADALRGLWVELVGVGADPNALWTTLSGGRHGIDTPVGFLTRVELVAPPLAPTQWYGLLAGLVGLSLVVVAGNRLFRREDTLGPVSIDELIVVATALAVATVLVGGPLLAGVALLPILFGVIVRRTRQLPGWKPSYAYVLAVCAPAVVLGAGWAGYGSLPADLLAFAVVGLAGAIGFPLRAQIRTHFGR